MSALGSYVQQRVRVIASLVAAMLALLPGSAWACPMCFSGNGTNQTAFLYGSLFLMVVPVGSIGGLVYWAHRRAKALDAPGPLAGVTTPEPAAEPVGVVALNAKPR